ncbi:putative metal-binding integral membrane protein (plasmid) [Leptolyngbya boryana NIES-2135]|jgi:predicted metal-binding membrane protein|uniref:Putative metal-binding integral membrane protein n=1 Tax=Leptolyngbya boryana NIES-2135 TaxID=1973484 RepID=A0A1Z4JR70_LEPBY|nr:MULTISPECIES: DUF2182 domain-containing protein [Leptolyngbya]BAY59210.1 putative metal-binding integral membrane protein [Leptolyngbya boryana NIES-2135]MBD2372798.1 DUF2182 domain-containing protein [Leptolyngbya sp. FACHB-238]MBD2397450.1 DUF2182 domain-containing protein [Leptolyngbya sp. FACHB-239]MBD2403745.1 DUF2182 domain-containing protein [Leptolyngbya sp. FACHB-402]ULP33403.1 DUF2182 domain-containing protein [Leptolyngbya boryana IU 594]
MNSSRPFGSTAWINWSSRLLIWTIVAIAWLLLMLTGYDHQHLTRHHQSVTPLTKTIARPFASWLLMTIAMMLPSTVPIAEKFVQIDARQAEGTTQATCNQILFLIACLVIWSSFSIAMIAIDIGLDFWLSPHFKHHVLFQPLILIGVGAFQFTPMKQACLKGCRSVSAFIAQYYPQGMIGSWNLGWQHGLYCLDCCWALMVGCAAIGIENLSNMLIFTAIMTLERLWKYGEHLSIWIGVVMIALEIVLVVYPQIN